MSDDLIRTIADTLEIQRLKAVYCTAADMVTWDPDRAARTFHDIFVPDVKADYGVAACSGRDALIGYLVSIIRDNNDWLMHGLQTPLIEVEGNRATGTWALMVQVKQKHLSGKEALVGRYSDEFVRTGEGWKISSVTFAEEGLYPLIDVTSQPVDEERKLRL